MLCATHFRDVVLFEQHSCHVQLDWVHFLTRGSAVQQQQQAGLDLIHHLSMLILQLKIV